MPTRFHCGACPSSMVRRALSITGPNGLKNP